MTLAADGFIEIGSSRLEYKMTGPRPDQAATFVLLHEGLGSVGIWGDFPARLADATGLGVFAYSRAGYGGSSPSVLPRRSPMASSTCGSTSRASSCMKVTRRGSTDGLEPP